MHLVDSSRFFFRVASGRRLRATNVPSEPCILLQSRPLAQRRSSGGTRRRSLSEHKRRCEHDPLCRVEWGNGTQLAVTVCGSGAVSGARR